MTDHADTIRPNATRWTAFAGEYVAAHACCKEDAIEQGRAKGYIVDRVVKRSRAYPFTHLHSEAVERFPRRKESW